MISTKLVRWLIVLFVTLVLSWVALGHTGSTSNTAPHIVWVPFVDLSRAIWCLLSSCPTSAAAARLRLIDGLGNIVVFIPFGVSVGLVAATMSFSSRNVALLAFIAGLGLSVFFEIAQLFIPGRVTAIDDLITNSLGAWLGGLLAIRISFAPEGLND